MWTGSVGQDVLDAAREHSVDVGLLEWWEPADGPATDDDVRVALRYGQSSAVGLVVDAGNVVQVRRPGDLRKVYAESEKVFAAARPAIAAVDRVIEERAPGWIARRIELDASIKAGQTTSVAEAELTAALIMEEREVDQELLSHWVRLGGYNPDAA